MKKYAITRSAKRIRVEVPVYFDQGTGVTKDVSQAGVFFLTSQDLSPGTAFNFVLELDYVCPGRPVYLHCRGEVVRVEGAGNQTGVAASINEFWTAE